MNNMSKKCGHNESQSGYNAKQFAVESMLEIGVAVFELKAKKYFCTKKEIIY